MMASLPSVVFLMSPSSRRAWIEIIAGLEGRFFVSSPSSRRAWIEILDQLLGEDRAGRRPPRGGRG